MLDISGVWAIEPNAAREYLKVYASILARKDAGLPLDAAAVEAATGTTLDNPSGQSTMGNVGIINCDGPIVKRGNLFSQVSGMASVDAMRAQFDALNADTDVSGIALCFNSPGGSISGIADFADHIRTAKSKPVVAYTDGLMASAAYWIGAAADQVVCSKTAMVGSIGAVMRFEDDAQMKANLGIEDVEILDSNAPLKSQEHAQDDVRAHLQGLVNDAGNEFRSAVAKFRGVSAATVRSDFGRGGMMLGKKAVAAGLADRVATFDTVIQELAGGKLKALPPQNHKAAQAAGGVIKMSFKDKLKALLHEEDEPRAALPSQAALVAALPAPVPQAQVGQVTIDGMTADEVRARLKVADEVLAAQAQSRIDGFASQFAAKIPPSAMAAAQAGFVAAMAAGNDKEYVAALDAIYATAPGAGPALGLVAGTRPTAPDARASEEADAKRIVDAGLGKRPEGGYDAYRVGANAMSNGAGRVN